MCDNPLPSTSVILLAGGVGRRMQTETPKQFLKLGDKPLIRHSFDLFLIMPEIHEIVVVCAPEYRSFFSSESKPIQFANPGLRRQDSVYNGLLATNKNHEMILIHDGARPFIEASVIQRALYAAQEWEAAATCMPISFTVKESNSHSFVCNTPDRTRLWEIQTPQAIKRKLLIKGFYNAIAHNLTVYDDVSLVELLGEKVKLVEGSHINFKITLPLDLTIANYLYNSLKNDSHVT